MAMLWESHLSLLARERLSQVGTFFQTQSLRMVEQFAWVVSEQVIYSPLSAAAVMIFMAWRLVDLEPFSMTQAL